MVNQTTLNFTIILSVLVTNCNAGAIASVDTFLPKAILHVRAILNCTGGEHNLTDCVEEFQLISSCAPFGTAAAVCLGMPCMFYIIIVV